MPADLILPQAPGFSWAALLAQWVPEDPYQPEDGTERYYETKARIAAYLKPTRVVEIGVRAGYSALAFHAGHPFTHFYGLDMDVGGWGGVAGYMGEARARLEPLFPAGQCILEKGDSQTMFQLPPEACNADLFHVDGDHSPKGCAHDIMLAMASGARWVLVDDYDYTRHVTEAADWIVSTYKLPHWSVSDGGYRGNLLIDAGSVSNTPATILERATGRVCGRDIPRAVAEMVENGLSQEAAWVEQFASVAKKNEDAP